MNQTFDIFELTPELVQENFTAPAAPHRHDFEELLIITAGTIEHFIDLNRAQMTGPFVLYVAEGKVHQFIPHPTARGWVIRFKTEFISDSKFHFYSYFQEIITYKLHPEFCANSLDDLCRMMLREIKHSSTDYTTIGHLLSALISKLEEEGDTVFRSVNNSANTQLITFNTFLKILQYNYQRPEGVQFYAEKMNTSARNLNLICKAIFNKSVSEIIETRKLIEARQLLLNSDKTISEIGFELGYNEKSYFTRVFHKKTGLTPSGFRAEMSTTRQ